MRVQYPPPTRPPMRVLRPAGERRRRVPGGAAAQPVASRGPPAGRLVTTALQVPYLDLGRARRRIAAPLEQRWQRILEASAFVLGPEVRELERELAALLGV